MGTRKAFFLDPYNTDIVKEIPGFDLNGLDYQNSSKSNPGVILSKMECAEKISGLQRFLL